MRRSLSSLMLAAATSLLVADVAAACSENVFRPGQGLAYRKLATAIPARVLIDADPASQGFTEARAEELQQSLREAGHTVVVMADARKLATILASQRFDVVLTSARNAETLGTVAPQDGPEPLGLPVGHAAATASARNGGPPGLAADASVRQVLKAIERALESRTR